MLQIVDGKDLFILHVQYQYLKKTNCYKICIVYTYDLILPASPDTMFICLFIYLFIFSR